MKLVHGIVVHVNLSSLLWVVADGQLRYLLGMQLWRLGYVLPHQFLGLLVYAWALLLYYFHLGITLDFVFVGSRISRRAQFGLNLVLAWVELEFLGIGVGSLTAVWFHVGEYMAIFLR